MPHPSSAQPLDDSADDTDTSTPKAAPAPVVPAPSAPSPATAPASTPAPAITTPASDPATYSNSGRSAVLPPTSVRPTTPMTLPPANAKATIPAPASPLPHAIILPLPPDDPAVVAHKAPAPKPAAKAVTKPAATPPAATKAVTTQPVVTQPAATKPFASQPVPSQPAPTPKPAVPAATGNPAPAAVTPAPIAAKPYQPLPAAPAPVSPATVTPAPVAPAPAASAPVTQSAVPAPTSQEPVSAQAAAATPADPNAPGATTFGFYAGETRDQIIAAIGKDNLLKQSGDILEVVASPKADPNFDSFLLIVGKDQGLVKLIATGKDIDEDPTGKAMKEQFSTLKTDLAKGYGDPSDNFDFLDVKATHRSPGQFMLSLTNSERTLAVYWTKKDFGNQITSVSLEGNGLGNDKGYLSLTYEFANYHAYLLAKK